MLTLRVSRLVGDVQLLIKDEAPAHELVQARGMALAGSLRALDWA